VELTGTKQGDHRRFTHTFTNLTPGTTYYVLAAPSSTKPTQRLTKTSTKSQQIEVTVEKIKVIDDADKGLRGKGDLLFQVRGTTTPTKSGAWGSAFGETKIGSGDTVNLKGSDKAPKHTFATKKSVVLRAGRGPRVGLGRRSRRGEFCESAYRQPGENHTARWLNSGDSGAECYQFSYAETAFDLDEGKSQTKTFSVARTPDLRFEVTVKMTMKAV
jgi:hypothetical protein